MPNDSTWTLRELEALKCMLERGEGVNIRDISKALGVHHTRASRLKQYVALNLGLRSDASIPDIIKAAHQQGIAD